MLVLTKHLFKTPDLHNVLVERSAYRFSERMVILRSLRQHNEVCFTTKNVLWSLSIIWMPDYVLAVNKKRLLLGSEGDKSRRWWTMSLIPALAR